jgi:hypothetical protein
MGALRLAPGLRLCYSYGGEVARSVDGGMMAAAND